jgi:hypothetical protein
MISANPSKGIFSIIYSESSSPKTLAKHKNSF